MNIEVLGCYGGVDPRHNPVTLLLDNAILLDAGTIVKELDLERQAKLHSIFLTHCHLDHIKDLCFLADNLVLMGKGPVNVYGLKEVLEMLKKYVMNNMVWPDFFEIRGKKGARILNLMPLQPRKPFSLGKDYSVEMVETSHTCASAGYIFSRNDHTVVYTGDTGSTEKMWKRLNMRQGKKSVIVEISFPDRLRDLAVTTGHLTPGLFLEEMHKIKDADQVRFYIFHMKPPLLREISTEIKKLPVRNIRMLSDGEKIRV